MKFRKTANVIRLVLAITAGLLAAGIAYAYDNKGPHGKINEFAFELFVKSEVTDTDRPDPVLKQYDFKNMRALTGESVVGIGDWRDDIKVDNVELTVAQWIKEGGFTADEPETQMSLLHFYDPTAPEGRRYLNDIPDLGRYYAAAQRKHWNPLGFLFPRKDVPTNNPQIDAVYWSTDGSDPAKFFQNEYSWKKGLEYMRQGFASKGKDKDFLYAKAWRSLGETMHLMGDMTVPAHVRNDAHPAVLPAGDLRPDPYEQLARVPVIEAAYQAIPKTQNYGRVDLSAAIDRNLFDEIERGTDPASLLHTVASYTNKNFFSADTVVGLDRHSNTLKNLNNGPEYPSPILKASDYDEQFMTYSKDVAGKKVLMVRETVLNGKGFLDWGHNQAGNALHGKDYGLDSNADIAQSQANVLIPIAVAANRKLIDLYMPRVSIKIEGVDTQKLTLSGSVIHQPYGAFDREMKFSNSPDTIVHLYANGVRYVQTEFEPKIVDGKINVDLSKLDLKGKVKLELDLDVAGIMVKSNAFDAEFNDLTPTATPGSSTAPTTQAAGDWVLQSMVPVPKQGTDGPCYFDHQLVIADGSFSSGNSWQDKGCVSGSNASGSSVTKGSWSPPPSYLKAGITLTLNLSVSSTASQTGGGRFSGGGGNLFLTKNPPKGDPAANMGSPYIVGDTRASGWTGDFPVSGSNSGSLKIPDGRKGDTLSIVASFAGPGGNARFAYLYEYGATNTPPDRQTPPTVIVPPTQTVTPSPIPTATQPPVASPTQGWQAPPVPTEISQSPGLAPTKAAATATLVGEQQFFSITSVKAVLNGATKPTTFSTADGIRYWNVTKIVNYHWNNGRGQTPGTIGLRALDGTVLGPWQATGEPGPGGVPNAYWVVRPPSGWLPAGTYTVIDSDPGTWSQNSETGGAGMSWGYGIPR